MQHAYDKEKKHAQLFWKDSQRWRFMHLKVPTPNLWRYDSLFVWVPRAVRAKCMRPKQIFASPEKTAY